MCVSSTLRSGVNSATNTAQMTRLSANKWNGHTATIGSFLRALVRFRSEIPAVIQLYVTLGIVTDKGKVIVFNWQHAQLHIAFAEYLALEFGIENPFPQSDGGMYQLYYQRYVKPGELSPDQPGVATTPCHTNSHTELLALFPELDSRYQVSPMALHTMNVQYGNMLLQLIDDEGTTEEIQNMYPLGRGTDVMAYILHRYAAFSQFESGHTLKLKMDLDAQMRGTLESPTTASFQSLHARIMNAYYNLSVDDRRSLREMAECFRNMIFFQCPETIIQSFNEKMRERDVQLDDLTGTVDVIRYVFAASDLRANIKAMQLQRTGRGLVSAPRSDPNKDRKQPAARDESGPPPSPCRICLKAGLGEHLHWHSQCPNRTGATPAKPAGRAQVAVDRTEQRRQDTPDYDEPVESYDNFFDLPREASYDPSVTGRAFSARAVAPAHEAYDPEKHKNGNYTKPLQNYQLKPLQHHVRETRYIEIIDLTHEEDFPMDKADPYFIHAGQLRDELPAAPEVDYLDLSARTEQEKSAVGDLLKKMRAPKRERTPSPSAYTEEEEDSEASDGYVRNALMFAPTPATHKVCGPDCVCPPSTRNSY